MLQPTTYPEINALLDELLHGMKAILNEELIGFYLEGSLALGDFDPATSDIDFIAAVARPLSTATFDELAAMHRQMRDSGQPFATEMEGSYIHLAALRRHDPADAVFPNLERGSDEVLKYKEHHSDWVIHRHIVREHGIVLFGPPAATLIDSVSADDIRAATGEVLRSWWGTPAAVEYICAAPPGGLAFIALTMCRALYALEYGAVVSKPVAGRWALATLDARWHTLIGRSLAWQLDDSLKPEMIAFVRYVAGMAQVDNYQASIRPV